VKELGPHIGGGGGGKPTMAEAGGKNPGGVSEALEAARKALDG
jgi:alanyl-tRNA synthetase